MKRLLLMIMMLTGTSTSSDTNFFNDKGKELLSYWDPAAFENLKGLLLQVMEYDTKAIASWGVDGMNAMKTPITTPICGFTDGYMIQAKTATYTGRFEVVDNRWVRVGDTDGMEFHFHTDGNGTNDNLMGATKPKICGSNYHHFGWRSGRKGPKEKAEKVGAHCYATADDGSVWIDVTGKKAVVTTSKTGKHDTYTI